MYFRLLSLEISSVVIMIDVGSAKRVCRFLCLGVGMDPGGCFGGDMLGAFVDCVDRVLRYVVRNASCSV